MDQITQIDTVIGSVNALIPSLGESSHKGMADTLVNRLGTYKTLLKQHKDALASGRDTNAIDEMIATFSIALSGIKEFDFETREVKIRGQWYPLDSFSLVDMDDAMLGPLEASVEAVLDLGIHVDTTVLQ